MQFHRIKVTVFSDLSLAATNSNVIALLTKTTRGKTLERFPSRVRITLFAEGSTGKLAINRFSNTDANRFDANDDPDGDGYPNIEEYLNSLARDDRRYDGFIGSGTGSLPPYNCGRAMF